jgi:hypothetical protein
MSLYPNLDQTFRLNKIGYLDKFLIAEAEAHRKTRRRYQRVVNVTHGLSTGVALAGLTLEAVGIALISSGFGALPGLVLAGIGSGAFVLDLACAAVIRKCTKKAMKHCEITRCATTKLGTIHKYVSEALRDCSISAEEFDRIVNEVNQNNKIKDEIRSKTAKKDSSKKERSFREGTRGGPCRVFKVRGRLRAEINCLCGCPAAGADEECNDVREVPTAPPLYSEVDILVMGAA